MIKPLDSPISHVKIGETESLSLGQTRFPIQAWLHGAIKKGSVLRIDINVDY